MMLDQQYTYGCEFYGAQPIVGLTPLTDKCYLSMSQSVADCKGAMLTGVTGAGKTETAKVSVKTFVVMAGINKIQLWIAYCKRLQV